MSKQLSIFRVIAVSALAIAFSISAPALTSSRSFVATTGNDSNMAVGCAATANCRTFAAALSVTNPGGEIVVVNSGGYGPAAISQPVVITAIGVDASISQTSSGDGLTINTSGNVTIRGLNLHGEASGTDGIAVTQIGFLRLYNVLVENFSNAGVNFGSAGKLAIYDSQINDNAQDGLLVGNASSVAYVHNTSFDHNGSGVDVSAGMATVADSDAVNNTGVGFYSAGGTLTLDNDRATFNTFGLATTGGGILYFANCLISNNTTAYDISGGPMTGTNPGTSLIAPGQVLAGTLATPIALQ